MFNLKDLNPASKFYFEDDGEEWVELRLCPEGKQNELRLQAGIKSGREFKPDGNGNVVAIDVIDNDDEKMLKFIDLLNDYQIKNWNIVDEGGNEIPCTQENKKLLMDECPAFSEPIEKFLEILRNNRKEQKDKEIKNS